jgi:uncharacterized membrane protein
MRVEKRLIVDADRDAVWDVVSDPDCYPSFMPNLERWETITEGPAHIGSRYTVHWKIGSAPVGGVVEVVEFDPARDLAWVSITGVTLRGRFRLRNAGERGTSVTFRLAYQAPGGLLGLLADRFASRQVGHTLAKSLENLRDLVEA